MPGPRRRRQDGRDFALDLETGSRRSPPRSVNGNDGLSPQTLQINDVRFGAPATVQSDWCSNIKMYCVAWDSLGTSDMSVPQYVNVANYNSIQGDNFRVFYVESPSPTGPVPATAVTMNGIDGLVQLL